MSSFYGNIKNSNRISLIFDKVYTSRTEMEKECKHLQSWTCVPYSLISQDYPVLWT